MENDDSCNPNLPRAKTELDDFYCRLGTSSDSLLADISYAIEKIRGRTPRSPIRANVLKAGLFSKTPTQDKQVAFLIVNHNDTSIFHLIKHFPKDKFESDEVSCAMVSLLSYVDNLASDDEFEKIVLIIKSFSGLSKAILHLISINSDELELGIGPQEKSKLILEKPELEKINLTFSKVLSYLKKLIRADYDHWEYDDMRVEIETIEIEFNVKLMAHVPYAKDSALIGETIRVKVPLTIFPGETPSAELITHQITKDMRLNIEQAIKGTLKISSSFKDFNSKTIQDLFTSSYY